MWRTEKKAQETRCCNLTQFLVLLYFLHLSLLRLGEGGDGEGALLHSVHTVLRLHHSDVRVLGPSCGVLRVL